MVSDLVNIIMFQLYRVSNISHNWYMQNAVILIRFLQCYQSACTIFLCHTCSPYNMNIHNILHIICDIYYAGPYFDAFKKKFKFDQELLKYLFCSLSPCSPKCSPNLHHRRLIFQQGDLCFSLHVSLFG